MKRLVVAKVVLFTLIFAPSGLAGTWIDSFEDGTFWSEWSLLDGSNSPVEVLDMTEGNGRLTMPLAAGQRIILSAGQFEGDLELRGQFVIPPFAADGGMGIVLRQSPSEEGNARVYARLSHTPDAQAN